MYYRDQKLTQSVGRPHKAGQSPALQEQRKRFLGYAGRHSLHECKKKSACSLGMTVGAWARCVSELKLRPPRQEAGGASPPPTKRKKKQIPHQLRGLGVTWRRRAA